MSLSAMPSFLSAATTLVIDSAAAWRAALTVERLTITPTRRSATSGLITTRPVPVTLIMCSGVVPFASTPRIGRGANAGLAIAATRAPVARPRASQRARDPGTGIETVVVDIGAAPWLVRPDGWPRGPET